MSSGRKKKKKQPTTTNSKGIFFPTGGNPHDTQTGSRAASRAAWMISWNWHAMDQWLVRHHSCTNFQNLTSRIHRYDGKYMWDPSSLYTQKSPGFFQPVGPSGCLLVLIDFDICWDRFNSNGRHPRIHSERLWWSSATHGIQWLGTNFPRDMDRRVLLGEHENWWKSWAGWWFGTFFMFPYIGNNTPNWLSYFSEGLKPPTRWVLMMLMWGLDWTWTDFVSWRGVF